VLFIGIEKFQGGGVGGPEVPPKDHRTSRDGGVKDPPRPRRAGDDAGQGRGETGRHCDSRT